MSVALEKGRGGWAAPAGVQRVNASEAAVSSDFGKA
jgi:hypothetical protein